MVMTWSKWNPFKPFGRHRDEVRRILRQVLDSTLDPREWDNFINIPMKGTPDLEEIRQQCESLRPEKYPGPNGSLVFDDAAREQLQHLLDRVQE